MLTQLRNLCNENYESRIPAQEIAKTFILLSGCAKPAKDDTTDSKADKEPTIGGAQLWRLGHHWRGVDAHNVCLVTI